MSISHAGSLSLGELLKIYQTSGVYNNFSENSALWDFVKKKRVAKPEGQEVRYQLKKSYGQSAFQFADPAGEGNYPDAQRSAHTLGKAYFKDFLCTVDVPRALLNKQGSEMASYVKDIFANELEAKAVAVARGLSRMVCGDGSSSLGRVSSVSLSAGVVSVVLSTATADAGSSHIGNFQIGEVVYAFADDTTARVITGPAINAMEVSDVDFDTDTVSLVGAAGTTITNIGSLAAGDYIYPTNSGIPDLSGAISDYGTLSRAFAGLESLSANDGRVVNNLTMSGAIKGTRKDAGAATIDRTHFQNVLSATKRARGKDKYNWTKAMMFDTVYDSMLESWETDRQIISMEDNKRGSKALGIQHLNDSVMFDTDEFISKQRIYILPEGDSLQFRGTDIEQVEVDGQKVHLGVNSSGHTRQNKIYMEGSGLLFCTDPASLGVIENFSI